MEKQDHLFIEVDINQIVKSYWEQLKKYTILANGKAGIKFDEKYYILDQEPLWAESKLFEEKK